MGERSGMGFNPDVEKAPERVNLLTNKEHAVKQLIKMEGQAWFDEQDGSRDFSIDYAIEQLNKGLRSQAIIYGQGGFHRYYLNDEGFIRFSQKHGLVEQAEKARGFGFDV